MGSLHEFEDDGRRRYLIAMKGSPVDVLAMCDSHILGGGELVLSEDDRTLIERENQRCPPMPSESWESPTPSLTRRISSGK